jgi:hypothetical protein
MTTAFSLNAPLIKLRELSVRPEKDVQLGFMKIFEVPTPFFPHRTTGRIVGSDSAGNDPGITTP